MSDNPYFMTSARLQLLLSFSCITRFSYHSTGYSCKQKYPFFKLKVSERRKPTKNMDRLEEFKQFAIELAQKGGEMMLEANSKQLGVDTKQHRTDFVTIYDRAIEKYIFDSLKERYPNHRFIGEESAGANNRLESNDPTWIVDPIDGTSNFVHGYPLCCVSIALAIDRQMVVGVTNAPFLKKMYTAVKGGGSYCNGEPIHVSRNVRRIEDAMILLEANYDPRDSDSRRHVFDSLLWKCQSVRHIGSACVCMAMIAEGVAEIFLHHNLCIWDMAAGYVLITEAGGQVCQYNGKPFDPHSGSCMGAANDELIRLTEEVTKNGY